LGGSAYDRLAERRADEAWLAAAWARPGTRVLPIAGNRLFAPRGEITWRSPDEVDGLDGRRILLGEQDGRASFALVLGPDLSDSEAWAGLRAVVATLPAADAAYVVHAIGIAEWHLAVRHCPRCGGLLESRQSGHVLVCSECGRQQFPRSDPAVIMLVTDDDGRALLGRQRVWPERRWSTLAGFVEPGESLEAAVRREVLEEVGVRVGEVSYFGSQPWPLPASLMVGFLARAESLDIEVDGQEIEEARWFTREEAFGGAAEGLVQMPSGISISRSLIEHWYGDRLPGEWH
jgi:NAD+ diphosphatase